MATKVHYARRGDLHIAFAVIGDGPIDVVFVPGFVSHLNRTLDPERWATAATWLERLARFARVITFDKVGTGLSDRSTDIPGLEDRMDDVRAVMDAVGSEQAALVGVSEGGPMSILFAATFPERVHSLTLYGACATFSRTDDHPWAATAEDAAARRDLVHEYWGTGLCLATLLPPGEVTDDNIDAFGEAEVASASPGAVARLMEMNGLIDVRSVLPAISVPTLVVHATNDNSVPFASGEYLARHIPGARFLPIEFNAHLSILQTTGAIVDWVDDFEEFVTGVRPVGFTDRVLATVLYTDIVDSTARASTLGDAAWKQLLDRHDRLVEARDRPSSGRFGEVNRRWCAGAFRRSGPGRVVQSCDRRRRAQTRTRGSGRAAHRRDRAPGRRHRRYLRTPRRTGRRAGRAPRGTRVAHRT